MLDMFIYLHEKIFSNYIYYTSITYILGKRPADTCCSSKEKNTPQTRNNIQLSLESLSGR